jgi:glycosyltransferase involved in cell wall biosynthesis
MPERPIKLLLFSTLYPSSARPGHGIFVETRLRELIKSGQVDVRVVAPVPWFPSTDERWGAHARMARTPHRETHNGIAVLHPRYLLPPKVGMNIAPLSLALGAASALRQLRREGFDFDVIDAHYFYPDGVAAALLSRWFDRPLAITARGSDLNQIGEFAWPRRQMRWATERASACIGVSTPLVDILRGWGVPAEKLLRLRNGVDTERFRPLPVAESRERLGLQGAPLILAVGNLVTHKGQGLVIEALAQIRQARPQARLVLVGEGPARAQFEAQARSLGVAEAVSFAGAVPNAELLHWYSAADVMVLASEREGWANVLLESMACGTPVVASSVGGSPEVVARPEVGRVVESRSPAAFAQAIESVLASPADRAEVRRYAEGFGWAPTTQAQVDLFSRMAKLGRVAGHAAATTGGRHA